MPGLGGVLSVRRRVHADSAGIVAVEEVCVDGQSDHDGHLHIDLLGSTVAFICASPPQLDASHHLLLLTAEGVLVRVETGPMRGGEVSISPLPLSGQHMARLASVSCMAATPSLACLGGTNGALLCFPVGGGADSAFQLREAQGLWGLMGRYVSSSPRPPPLRGWC